MPGSPVVLVLASGRGERFLASGGVGSKLHADLGGRSVLERTLGSVRASGLDFHVEDAGHPGMGDSIAAAVRATPDAGGWLVLPGDLPLVQPESLRAVAQALVPGHVVVPMHHGAKGHPVGFAASSGAALMVLRGSEGAAAIVTSHRVAGRVIELPLDDPGIVTDIDTVHDLERMRASLRTDS